MNGDACEVLMDPAEADKTLALKPLEGPFNDLLKAFDQLKPEDVVKPLDDAVHKAIDTVLHVIPVDAVFAQVDAVMKKIKDVSMKNYNCSLAEGIRRSPKFEEKGLAQYAINVGVRCGHDCTYCSSRAMLRTALFHAP